MPIKKSVTGFRVKAADVTFNTFGTGPAVTSIRGGSAAVTDGSEDPEIRDLANAGNPVIKVVVTSGSGAGTAAANNIVVTLPTGVNPRRVFIDGGGSDRGFGVTSISNNVINIGMRQNSAASTAYPITLICVM